MTTPFHGAILLVGLHETGQVECVCVCSVCVCDIAKWLGHQLVSEKVADFIHTASVYPAVKW